MPKLLFILFLLLAPQAATASIFDRIAHAFKPVQQVVEKAGHEFNPQHVADAIKNAIIQPVKSKLPGHLNWHDAKDYIKLAEPDEISLDLFGSIGVSLGIELELGFDVGITIDEPVEKFEALEALIENPPERVHGVLDALWHILPSEIHVQETLQAGVGETVAIKWTRDGKMPKVVSFVTKQGWLEKRVRP